MPLRVTLSQDGHPMGVAVGVFVQNSPPAVSVGWPEPSGLLPAFLGAGHLCCGRVRRIDDDVLVRVDIGQGYACDTPPGVATGRMPPARERRGRMTPETAYDLDITPEYTLLLAIIRRAHEDLRDHAPPHERASSIQFFNNQYRHFELLCSLMDLDYEGMQEAVWRQYPQWF